MLSFALVPWSGVPSLPCLPLLLLFLQSQIKVISPRKTHFHASVIPENPAYASIKAHTEYYGLFPCLALMLDCEVFQGRDWVFIEESLASTSTSPDT